VINKLTHVETGANRNLQVTTKPEVLKASLRPINMQDNTVSIKNISTETLQIFHQNIQGLRWKSSEVLNFLYPILPHILCFTEHHLHQHEMELIQIDSFTLGASFCRNSLQVDGVCIFVNKNLNFMNVDLRKFSHDQDIEVGAVKLSVYSLNICVLSIYRAPGNFAHFLNKLEMILDLLHSNNTQLIICGDININYLVENNKKKTFWILYWLRVT
jgi:exonuclease III